MARDPITTLGREGLSRWIERAGNNSATAIEDMTRHGGWEIACQAAIADRDRGTPADRPVYPSEFLDQTYTLNHVEFWSAEASGQPSRKETGRGHKVDQRGREPSILLDATAERLDPWR